MKIPGRELVPVQQMGQVEQPLGHDVNDLALALDVAFGPQGSARDVESCATAQTGTKGRWSEYGFPSFVAGQQTTPSTIAMTTLSLSNPGDFRNGETSDVRIAHDELPRPSVDAIFDTRTAGRDGENAIMNIQLFAAGACDCCV